ncbi:hypothetical protein Kpho02_59600 [Kitasatospora phosalacinea]|uniref:DUF6879 domain-containing protein n=1 Tax=Kitasatospora phosalacinea TaxID=2065 RepID=A0A9W6QDV4_9ACTN|nr:DUF6879 family protein [Kitasatospora phosalacinea]GLW73661.1 hypothetical protein Kpho02_59600 [Kitasatospora phosalacinea]
MTQSVTGFSDLLASARHSAVHLEMRDTYAVADEAERIEQWRAGHRLDPADRESWWRPWLDTIAATVARGVVVRRARIVSEPVSEYTRYLHSMTFTNIAAGEQVRWLPRMQASTIALPGSDFWLFDGKVVMFNHFTGDGDWADPEDTVSDDPAVAKLCAEAFETVWERAVPHEQYTV